jgi:MYXO-CTERM domain-containing protein
MSRLLLLVEILFFILGACAVLAALAVTHVPRPGIPSEFFTLLLGLLLLLGSTALRFLRRRRSEKTRSS